MHKTYIVICLLLLSVTPVFATCLSLDETNAIMQIENQSNITNYTLVNLFETICQYNTSINIVNETMFNRTSELYNFSQLVNETMQNISLNMTNVSLDINETLKKINEITNISDTVRNDVNSQIEDITKSVVNSTLDEMTEQKLTEFFSSRVSPIQDQIIELEDKQIEDFGRIMNETPRNTTFNSIIEDLKNDLNIGIAGISLEVSNTMFPLFIGIIALGIFVVYSVYLKPKYPIFKDRNMLPLKGKKILPQELSDSEYEDVRADVKSMRKFIHSQVQFKPTTRSIVWQMYQDEQLDNQEEAIQQMELIEPNFNKNISPLPIEPEPVKKKYVRKKKREDINKGLKEIKDELNDKE